MFKNPEIEVSISTSEIVMSISGWGCSVHLMYRNIELQTQLLIRDAG